MKINAIITIYRRPETAKLQIEHLLNQSEGKLQYKDIYVWHNKSDVVFDLNSIRSLGVNIIESSWNTKFWGRFTIPLLLDSDYVMILDDDILPQKKWIENCLHTIESKNTNGILGGSGILLPETGYKNHKKIGWNGVHLSSPTEVDLVGHSWFFRKEWAKYIWSENPYTWNNGEDIMFSYLAQKYGKIKTFVPPHSEKSKDLWCTNQEYSMKVGNDSRASYKKKTHMGERDQCVEHCKGKGWQILREKKDVPLPEHNKFFSFGVNDIDLKRYVEIEKIKKEQGEYTVTANMATFKKRKEFLPYVVREVLPCVDRLRIYLNDYDEIPDFLVHPKIDVVFGKGDIRAKGKYYFLPTSFEKQYYFSIDDDFIYHPSYFLKSIQYLKKNQTHVISNHGVLIYYNNNDQTYKQTYKKYNSGALDCLNDHETNILGTGMLCFDAAFTKIPYTKQVFPFNGMIDLCMSKYLLSHKKKMVVRAHRADEIFSLHEESRFKTADLNYKLSNDKQFENLRIKFLIENQQLFNGKYKELTEGTNENSEV
jgi:hypothetical protein